MIKDELQREDINMFFYRSFIQNWSRCSLGCEEYFGIRKCIILFVLIQNMLLQNTFISLVVIQQGLNELMTQIWVTVVRVACLRWREVVRYPCTREKQLLDLEKSMIFHFNRKQGRARTSHAAVCRVLGKHAPFLLFFGMLPICQKVKRNVIR